MSSSSSAGGRGGRRGRGRGKTNPASGGARKCIQFTAAETAAALLSPSPNPKESEKGTPSTSGSTGSAPPHLFYASSNKKKQRIMPSQRPTQVHHQQHDEVIAVNVDTDTAMQKGSSGMVQPGVPSSSATQHDHHDDESYNEGDLLVVTDVAAQQKATGIVDVDLASGSKKEMRLVPPLAEPLVSASCHGREYRPSNAGRGRASRVTSPPVLADDDVAYGDSSDIPIRDDDDSPSPPPPVSDADDDIVEDPDWQGGSLPKKTRPSSQYQLLISSTSSSDDAESDTVAEDVQAPPLGNKPTSKQAKSHFSLFNAMKTSQSASVQAEKRSRAGPIKTPSQTRPPSNAADTVVFMRAHDRACTVPPPGPPTQKHQAQVWSFFQCPDAEQRHLVECTTCKKRLTRGKPGTPGLGTTVMIRHMKNAHFSVWSKYLQKSSSPASASIQQHQRNVAAPSLATPVLGHAASPPMAAERQGVRPLLDSSPASPALLNEPVTPTSCDSPCVPLKRAFFTPVQSRQPTLQESIERKAPYQKGHDRVRLLNSKVAKMIAVEMLPYSFVEKKGFRELMNAADPRWQIPSRSYFTRKAVPDLFHEVVNSVGNALCQSESQRVHLTTDIWTSQQSIDYMSVTAHWVTFPPVASASHRQAQSQQKHTYRHKATLCMDSFGGLTHNAENLLAKLREVIEQWLTPRQLQVGCVASDNAANIRAALRKGRIQHIPCFAHVLHLVVTGFLNGNEAISATLNAAKKICSHFSRSYRSRHALRKLQQKHNLPPHQLKLDVVTRWNSTLYMLQRLVEQRRAITDFLNDNSQSIGDVYLPPKDWQLIVDLCDVLGPFENATRIVSASSASVSQILPLICILEKNFMEMLSGCGGDAKATTSTTSKAALVKKVLGIFQSDSRIVGMKSSDMYLLATFLDPRFKTKVVEMGTVPTEHFNASTSSDADQCNMVEPQLSRLTYCKERLEARLDECLAEIRSEGTSIQLNEKASTSCSSSQQSMMATHSQQQHRDSRPLARQVEKSTPGAGGGDDDDPTSLWSSLLTKYSLCKASAPDSQLDQAGPSGSEMVSAYLNDTMQLTPNQEPLDYWLGKRGMWHKALICVAIEYLSCPPASVESERVFSAAGAIVTERRTSLTSHNVEKLAFLKMNEHHIPANYGSVPLQGSVTGRRGDSSSSASHGGTAAHRSTFTLGATRTVGSVVESDDGDEWESNSGDDE